MEQVKNTENYTIFKKRSGRFAVKGANKKFVNGAEKAEILAKEGLVKVSKAAEKPAEEAPAEESAEAGESTEE